MLSVETAYAARAATVPRAPRATGGHCPVSTWMSLPGQILSERCLCHLVYTRLAIGEHIIHLKQPYF